MSKCNVSQDQPITLSSVPHLYNGSHSPYGTNKMNSKCDYKIHN